MTACPMSVELHLPPALADIPFASALAWCGGPAGSIVALLFLTRLVRSISHCGPMCRLFVLARMTGFSVPATLERRKGSLLLPYHLGRTMT